MLGAAERLDERYAAEAAGLSEGWGSNPGSRIFAFWKRLKKTNFMGWVDEN